VNINLEIGDKSDISLAEIFHSDNQIKNVSFTKKSKVGFI
jgi:hypothetical protein